jgi:hypothetical protein
MQAQAHVPLGEGSRFLIKNDAENGRPLVILSNTRRIGGGHGPELNQPVAGHWPPAGVEHANSSYTAPTVSSFEQQ